MICVLPSHIHKLKSKIYVKEEADISPASLLAELEQRAKFQRIVKRKYFGDFNERGGKVKSPVRMFKRNERNKLQFFI